MALFQHNQRGISYHVELAPFAFDLLLLQPPGQAMDSWHSVLQFLRRAPQAGGRVVTCDWHDAKLATAQMAEDLIRWIRTLALQNLHVVAIDQAVALVDEIEKRDPDLILKTLLYPKAAPIDLERAISDFCGL